MEVFEKLPAYREDLLRDYKEDLVRAQVAHSEPHVVFTKGSKELVEVMRGMVNNPECSDVTFVCEDGRRVQASRMLLVARCAVLKGLLCSRTTGSMKSEVVLAEIPSEVFILILKYLYTGEVWSVDLKRSDDATGKDAAGQEHYHESTYFGLDWLFLCRVMKAARFFWLDRLEYSIMSRLWADIPCDSFYTEDVLSQVTSRLTTISSFVADFRCSRNTEQSDIVLLSLYLVKIMVEHELNVFHIRNLSYKAMHFYLFNTENLSKNGKDEDWNLSFREYVRLWQLILWCTFCGTEVTPEVAALCFQEHQAAVSVIMKSEEQKQCLDELPSSRAKLRQIIADTIQRDRFAQMKSMINIVDIYPELLMKVVEPLRIYSAEELMAVYKEQLTRASSWRKEYRSLAPECKCQWLLRDGKNVRETIDNTLALRGNEDPADVLFVANVAMWCHAVCEWDIVQTFRFFDVGKAICPNFAMEVGYLSSEYGECFENVSLSRSTRGWALRLWNDGKAKHIQGMFFEKGELKGGLPSELGTVTTDFTVRILLDRIKKTCTLKYKPAGIQYSEYTVEFQHLPSGYLYPAVHMSCQSKCCSETRIDLIRGFELSQ